MLGNLFKSLVCWGENGVVGFGTVQKVNQVVVLVD